jgi:hypothetical protein
VNFGNLSFLEENPNEAIISYPACGSPDCHRAISAPQIRTDDNAASYVDGTRRKGVEDMKKIAKLEVERTGLPANSERRREINAEIAARRTIRK